MARLGRAQPFPPKLGRTLPPAAPPETITLDKWIGDPARIVRRGAAVALLVAGLVAPLPVGPDAALVEVSPAPVLQRLRARVPDGLTAPVTTPAAAEDITLDKWLGDPPRVVRARAWLRLPATALSPLPIPNAAAPDGTAAFATTPPAQIPRARFQRARYLPAAVANLLPIPGTGPDAPGTPPSGTGLVPRLPRVQIQQVAAPVPHADTSAGPIRPPEDSGTLARRPRILLYQATAAPPRAPLVPSPDPVGWDPVLPRTVLLRRTRPILVARQQALVAPSPVPIPNPPAPERSWAPTAPDRARLVLRLPVAVVPVLVVPALPTTTPALLSSMWEPEFPDRTLRARSALHLRAGATLPPIASSTIVVTSVGAWATTAPAAHPHRPLPTAVWVAASLLPPPTSTIIGGAITCVHLRDTDVRWPRLVDERVTEATAVDGRVSGPTTEEDVC